MECNSADEVAELASPQSVCEGHGSLVTRACTNTHLSGVILGQFIYILMIHFQILGLFHSHSF